MSKLDDLRAAGFNDQEIQQWQAQKEQQLNAAGFSQDEILQYFGGKPVGSADAPIRKTIENNIMVKSKDSFNPDGSPKPLSFLDALDAGFQMSVTGLAIRHNTPDLLISKNDPWYNRAAASMAQLVGDVPAMVAGAIAGGGAGSETGPGAAITAMGGTFALPAALRGVMVDSYLNGDFKTFPDFWQRASSILIDSAKNYVTGAATAGAGYGTGIALKGMSPAVQQVGQFASGVATMTTVGKALEGQVPNAQDFLDTAVVLLGAHGAMLGARKLGEIYRQTGITPQQVVKDAQADPTIAQDLASNGNEIPKSYQGKIDPNYKPPIDTQAARPGEDLAPLVPRAETGSLTPLDVKIESRMADLVANHYNESVAAYDALPEAQGGKILNVDTAREISPDYAVSNDSRSALAAAVHEPSSWFIKKLYSDRLAQMPPDSTVMFTSGGTGAGKSSSITKIPSLKEAADRAYLVYDTNMNTFKSAQTKIDQALQAGANIEIVHVMRDPVQALVKGALPRAMRMGRTVRLSAHEATHVGSADAIVKVAEHYKNDPRVKIDVVDNTNGKGIVKLSTLEFVRNFDYNGLSEKLHKAVREEYQNGRISKTVHDHTLGISPFLDPSVQGGVQAGISVGDGRGNPAANGRGGETRSSAGVPAGSPSGPVQELNRKSFPVQGNQSIAVTERGQQIATRFAVVDIKSLQTSHDTQLKPNPKFPRELQPRDRTRAASSAQIARISANINPELLAESPKASDGAPIVGQDLAVESGNARSIALRMAYDQGNADNYRAWLIQNAERFGLDPKAIDKISQPVLVRVGTGKYGRAEFARQANESSVAQMSVTETAQADAQRLPDLGELRTNEDGSINVGQSMNFIRSFVSRVGANEHGSMMTADGTLSQQGLQRIRNAIFAKAYGDPEIVSMMAESTDANIKNILNGMTRAAPAVARLKEMIAEGGREPMDISPDLSKAVRIYSQARADGMTVQELLAQGSLFDSGISPAVHNLLIGLEENSRSGKRIAEMIQGYVDRVDRLGDPRQADMLGTSKPTEAQLIGGSVTDMRANTQAEGQSDLFNENVDSTVPTELAKPATNDPYGIGKPVPEIPREKILAELDQITAAAKDRMDAAWKKAPSTMTASGATELDFMTPAEKARRHELLGMLPSYGQEVAAAKSRVAARIQNIRKNAQGSKNGVLSGPDLSAPKPSTEAGGANTGPNSPIGEAKNPNPPNRPPVPPAPPPPPRPPGSPAASAKDILDHVQIGGETINHGMSLDRLYTLSIDDLNPIKQAVRAMANGQEIPADLNPYIIARNNRGMFGRASQMLENATFDFKTFRNNGKSFQSIVEPFKADLDGFRAYLVANRTVELAGRGIKTGIDEGQARQVVASGSAKYGQAAKDLIEYQDHVVQYLRDSGVISQEGYDAMRAANKQYVPFFRVMDDSGSGGGVGKGLQPKNPIKAIKGSERLIIDPLESIIKNTYAYITLADRNAVAQTFVDLALKSGAPEKFIAKVSAPVRPIDVSAEEMARFLKSEGIQGSPDEMLTVFRAIRTPLANDEIAVFNDGKRTVYQVDPEVGRVFNALDQQSANVLMKVLSEPARLLRAGATLTPDFMLRNVLRDNITAAAYSKTGFIPVYDTFRGFASIMKKDASYQEWLKSGGANSTMVALDRKYIQTELFKLTGENPGANFLDKTWNLATKPIEFLRISSELFENATRLGDFRRGIDAHGKTKAEILSAGFDSREVTLDFARIGAKMRAMNQITAFFNAQVQGTDRAIRAFKDNPLGTTARVAAAITLPSVILWAANHNDPRWKEIPAWQRDLFWIVLTKDHIYRIPKPFELGIVFGSGVERMLDALFADGNVHNAEDFLNTMVSGILPNFIPTAAQPLVEQITNYGFFSGHALVPDRLMQMLPEYRYAEYTSQLSQELGHILGHVPYVKDTNVASPIVIDNYIREWTGGMGSYAMQIADAGLRKAGVLPDPVLPTSTLSDIPVIKAFTVRYPSASAESIQIFREDYQDLAMRYNTFKQLAAQGDVKSALAVIQADPVAMAKLDSIQKMLGQQTQLIRLIYKNPQIGPDEKRQLIDSAYYQMIEVTRLGNNLMKQIRKSLPELPKQAAPAGGLP